MPTARTITLTLAFFLGASQALAYDVYHWVDEEGVPHYSQEAPEDPIEGVRKIQLEDATPADLDPDEDIYGVQQQADRMAALRKDMQQRRDAAKERQRNSPQPGMVIYQNAYPSYSHRIWLPPAYPRPPVRPEHPIAVPYLTETLAPPGG